MAKFSIKVNPTFNSVVSIPRVGGDPIEVEFTFKYMSRKELAALFDKWAEASQEYIDKLKDSENLTNIQWVTDEVSLQIQQIKDITIGWKFEDQFNDENIEALVETSVGAADAVIAAYRDSYAKVREAK